MNKSELIEQLAEKTGLSKTDLNHTVDAFLEIITKELQAGLEVSLLGFGHFKVVHRAARQGRNPSTGESVKIPASRRVQFKVGKKLKEAVNE